MGRKGIYLFQKINEGNLLIQLTLIYYTFHMREKLLKTMVSATEEMFTRTVSPNKAPDEEEEVIIEFKGELRFQ